MLAIELSPGSTAKQQLPNKPGRYLIKYQVTNTTRKPQSLFIRPIAGTDIYAADASACKNGKSLNTNASCTLTLLLTPLKIKAPITGGPIICLDETSLRCFQPAMDQTLDISIRSEPSANAPMLVVNTTTLALSVNNPTLNPALTGNPRQIHIKNDGTAPAVNVNFLPYDPKSNQGKTLPSDITILSHQCKYIAVGESCTLTIKPGKHATPPSGINLSIQGENTEAVIVTFHVLTYGSKYQSGILFSVNDTNPSTPSIGGLVAQATPQKRSWPLGIIFSYNNIPQCNPNDPAFDPEVDCTLYSTFTPRDLYGIYENSQKVLGDKCDANIDGKCNTHVLWSFYDAKGISKASYAAGLCFGEISGYSDWYLPAICQMGFFSETSTKDIGCGNTDNPTIQNMQQNLASWVSSNKRNNIAGTYWSSTASSRLGGSYGYLPESCPSTEACYAAWSQYFSFGRDITESSQLDYGKENTNGVWCIRDITQPKS